MRLTVLGSNGLLGSTLSRLATACGLKVTAMPREVLDLGSVSDLDGWAPDADWVVNCAAITDVDACDGERAVESLFVNAMAPERVAAACRSAGAGFVHIGTDYVFYGDGLGSGEDGQYDETDDPSPRNRYGAHKLMGEAGARASGAYVLRTAWVYGPGGKNFVSKAYDLAVAGKALPVDSVSSSTPTLAGNLARYILAVVEADDRASGEVYHCCDAGEATRWEVFDRVRRAMLPATKAWGVAHGELYAGGVARPVRTPLDSSAFFLRFGGLAEQMSVKDSVAEYVVQCRARSERVVSGEVV